MTFAYFNLKTRIFTVVCFKNILKNIIKNLFSNIAFFFVAKCEKRESYLKCQSFCGKTVYFTEQNVLLKQPNKIGYLIKQKPRGALAGKLERMRRGR